MATVSINPVSTRAWVQLSDLATQHINLNELFAKVPDRWDDFTYFQSEILVDLSRNLWTPVVRSALLDLAAETKVLERRNRMFTGEIINTTENRAVLHTALRSQPESVFDANGQSISKNVHDTLQRVYAFARRIRKGDIVGATGHKFRHVVNIGIGGSDLGPLMVTEALKPFGCPNLDMHFVSNVDGSHLYDTLASLDPEKTLFIVASKTFTTDETMTNALAARHWIASGLSNGADVGAHFAAVSTAADKVQAFGIRPSHTFVFWEWVGGRFSLWSSVGLSIVIAIGPENFADFLSGAHEMDQHFANAPAGQNIPLLIGLLGVWYRNFLSASSVAVLPYDQRLHRLPAYLQQMDMESNGKGVRSDGSSVTYQTGPVLWGEPGTNGQHAFYQLIHQGTSLVPVDFLVAANASTPYTEHHQKLVTNCLAQGEALMRGKTADQVRRDMIAAGLSADQIDHLGPHQVLPGNRPSTTIMYPYLTPFILGQLIALYEHKIFVQGAVWGINSYDQWGVELGKTMAKSLLPIVQGGVCPDEVSSSTRGLIAQYAAWVGK